MRDKKTAVGTFMLTSDPGYIEAAGYAGLDFVIIDMEHGPLGLSEVQNNIRAAQLAGALPIVRVSKLCPVSIGQVLDAGAAGVQVPQITTAEEARIAVQGAKFHPHGNRGVNIFVRAAQYSSMPKNEFFSSANEDKLVILQIEGKAALDELDEILTVSGLDGIFIGPFDLSQSYGVTGQIDHPLVVDAMKDIVQRAKKAGVATSTYTDSVESMKKWSEIGVQWLVYTVDTHIFSHAIRTTLHAFKGGNV